MRRLLSFLTIVSLVAAPLGAGEQHTFVRNFNLQTPTVAATTNYVVVSTLPVNSTYTLAHQPDTPRNLTGTITSGTINAGTVTIAGTDVNGNAQTEVWTLTGGGGALTFVGVKVWASITSITGAAINVIGGGDTIIMGVGSTTAYLYCSTTDPIPGRTRITTQVGGSTTVTAVNSLPSFGVLSAGDDVVVATGPGTTQRATVSSITNDTTMVIGTSLDWSNGGNGYPWQYRHVVCGYADTNGWQVMELLRDTNVRVDLGDGSGAATNAVGGLSFSVECRFAGDATLPSQILATNVTAVLRPQSSNTFLIKESCSSVRVGLKWGTNASGTTSVSGYLLANDIGPTH